MAISKLDLVTQFAEAFVERIRGLPHLHEVVLDDRDGEVQIWTLIDAPRMRDEDREPIYRAELETYREFPSVEAEFRLINVREYRESGIEPPAFADAPRLWPPGK